MAKIALEKRVEVLLKLGEYWRQDRDFFKAQLTAAHHQNNWFNPANGWAAMENIALDLLVESEITRFLSAYPECEDLNGEIDTIGIVAAGNIPLVAFHDVLCGWLSGHKINVKLSDKDSILMTMAIDFMKSQCSEEEQEFLVATEKLKNYNKIIATGSNSSSIYFEQYFGNVKNIIRKNRSSVAVLNGEESEADIMELGLDIFRYFGLGCRSVSKLYLPKGYDVARVLSVLDNYKDICNHTKYANNFDYNRSILLLNKEKHYHNDCIALVENKSLMSRIATLNYEFYTDINKVSNHLIKNQQSLQCVACNL